MLHMVNVTLIGLVMHLQNALEEIITDSGSADLIAYIEGDDDVTQNDLWF